MFLPLLGHYARLASPLNATALDVSCAKLLKKQGEQATVSLFFLRLYKLKSNLRPISFSKTVIFNQDPCASKLPRKYQGYRQELEIS